MAPKHTDQIQSTHDIIKGEFDSMLYRGLTLKNGIKVVLVSDPTAKKSAAAVSVQVGYVSDPENFDGLSILRARWSSGAVSKKYPSENHFYPLLSSHGGEAYSIVASDHTCSHFHVAPEKFREAFEIFAQGFLDPAFDQDTVDRELKRALIDEPAAERIEIRRALLDFNARYYSSNVMNVCLLGREPLNDLSNLAVEMLEGVENTGIEAPMWRQHPYGPSRIKKQSNTVAPNDINSMVIRFLIDGMRIAINAGADVYVSHLLNHDGDGSLLFHLREKNWVKSLSASVDFGMSGRSFTTFCISMNLTAEGLQHTDDIATSLFQYLKLIRDSGPQHSVFEDIQSVRSLRFRMKPKESSIGCVVSVTDSMQFHEWKNILSAPYVVEDFKPELIDEFLSHLTPETMHIELSSQNFVEYSSDSIPVERIEAWKHVGLNETLSLPPINEFIPRNLELVQREPKHIFSPRLLVNEYLNRFWFMQDGEFNFPRGIFRIQLRRPIVDNVDLQLNQLAIIIRSFIDANRGYFHSASLAGVSFKFDGDTGGLGITVMSYGERLQALLEETCERLSSLEIDAHRLELLQEQSSMGATADPKLPGKRFTPAEMRALTENCTAERCNEFLKELLEHAAIECLAYGNVRSEEAYNMSNTVRRIFKFDDRTFGETGPVGNALPVTADVHCTAMTRMLCTIMEDPYIGPLRGKPENLESILDVIRRPRAVGKLRAVVRPASRHFPQQAAEDLASLFAETFGKLSAEDFEKYKEALMASRPETPDEKFDELWSEIDGRSYFFNRRELEVEVMKKLTLTQVVEFFDQHVVGEDPAASELLATIVSRIRSSARPDSVGGVLYPGR